MNGRSEKRDPSILLIATPGQRRAKKFKKSQTRSKSAGVFQVQNIANSAVLPGSSIHFDTPLNNHELMLKTGGHSNKTKPN